MICCDQCEQWYHGECVGISKGEADKMGRYQCDSCSGETTETRAPSHDFRSPDIPLL